MPPLANQLRPHEPVFFSDTLHVFSVVSKAVVKKLQLEETAFGFLDCFGINKKKQCIAYFCRAN